MLLQIMALYSCPSAAVRVNGHLSNAFSISNGTRQGCPLSPLIYIMSLEPFLNRLRNNPDIQGVNVKDKEFKFAAFADDILRSLKLPWTTLPNLLKDIEFFGILSNLKINQTKLHALNVTLPPQEVTHCQESFPFQWERGAIAYLGIQIPTSLSNLYMKNIHTALTKTQKYLKDWMSLNVWWFGHSALITMIILPHLLYLIQSVPIHLPPYLFASYQKACSSFIWKNSPPRIKYIRLTLHKTKGVLGWRIYTSITQHVTLPGSQTEKYCTYT